MTKKVEDKDKSANIYRKLLAIIVGNLLCALAFNIFFIPNKLLSGGVGGLAIIVQYLTDIPSGIVVFTINIPIFLIGYKMVDKDFAIYSFISMFILSFLLTITNGIDAYFPLNDILLGSVFGGVLNGVGMGLMFRNRTSQGGLDIIAAVLKRKYNINIGTGLMMVNTVIISLAGIRFGVQSAMYTLISMYIGYQILDKVQTGFNVRKNVVIVSNNSEKIASEIIRKLNRGVTFLEGMGAYTKENRQVIYCIVNSNEIVKLKGIVDEVDPEAFLTINEVVEVEGSGFKNAGI
ncbi:MAG TPA: YitT family protein [Tissierellaceae bacterium]|nr:YitT family protein [Tissierellaceae bacterium]